MPLTYSSTAFPDIQGQVYSRAPGFQTVRSVAEAPGSDVARTLGATLYRYELGWSFLTRDQLSLVMEALVMTGIAWGTLNFFEWESLIEIDAPVGVGDGVANTFVLPGKGITGLTVKVGQAVVGVTFLGASGPDGEDRIQFVTPPATSSVITCSWGTGRRRRKIGWEHGTSDPRFEFSGLDRWTAACQLIEVP